MIRQSGRFTFKEFFYAFDFNSLKIRPIGGGSSVSASVNGIWFKRDNGADVVCMGTISEMYDAGSVITAEYFMDNYHSGRYGGSARFKWDGVKMYSADNVYDDLVKAHDYLDPILRKFIDDRSIPHGYDGWYSIKD